MLEDYQYLVDRYSPSLTKYDVMELFRRLEDIKGNKTAATIEADIQRKTVWDWVHNTKDVKEATKRKILEANLNTDPYGTIAFLVRKNSIDFNEILQRCIYMLYDNILRLNEKSEVQKGISRFDKCIKAHSGAIFGIKTIPIEEIIDTINQKASEFGVTGIAKDINIISPQRLSQKFINLLESFTNKTIFKDEIEKKLGLPREFVDRAVKVSSYIDPPILSDEDTLEEPYIKIPRIGDPSPKQDTLEEPYIKIPRIGDPSQKLSYIYSTRNK